MSSYRNAINTLRSANSNAFHTLQQNNIDVGNWESKKAIAEGQFLAKASQTAANLIAQKHEQYRQSEQTRAVEDWYAMQYDWNDPNALTTKQVLEDAEKADLELHSQGIKFRQSGGDPKIANLIANQSPVYAAQIAKLKLNQDASNFEPWVRNQLLNNDTWIGEEGQPGSFQINDIPLNNLEQTQQAYEYLRRKYWNDTGASQFGKDFLNQTGYFESFRKIDSKLYSEFSSTSDISQSAERRRISINTFLNEPTTANLLSMVNSIGNGVDLDGKFIGRAEAWGNNWTEKIVKNAMLSGKLTPEQFETLRNTPIDPKDPKSPSLKKKWEERWGDNGVFERELGEAQQKIHTEEQETKTDNQEKAQLSSITLLREANFNRNAYTALRKELRNTWPELDTDMLDTAFESNNKSNVNADDVINDIITKKNQGLFVGDLIKSSSWKVQTDERIKKILDNEEAVLKSPAHKANQNTITGWLKAKWKFQGHPSEWQLDSTSKNLANAKIQQKYKELLNIGMANPEVFQQEGLSLENWAIVNTEKWLMANGGNAMDNQNTNALFYMENNEMPNLLNPIKESTKNVTEAIDSKIKAITEYAKTYKGGLEAALYSPNLPVGDNKASTNFNQSLALGEPIPSDVLAFARRLKIDPFEYMNARSQSHGNGPLDPKYRSAASEAINGLPTNWKRKIFGEQPTLDKTTRTMAEVAKKKNAGPVDIDGNPIDMSQVEKEMIIDFCENINGDPELGSEIVGAAEAFGMEPVGILTGVMAMGGEVTNPFLDLKSSESIHDFTELIYNNEDFLQALMDSPNYKRIKYACTGDINFYPRRTSLSNMQQLRNMKL